MKRETWIIETVGGGVALPFPDEAKNTRREAIERAELLAQYGFIPVKYQVTCYVPRDEAKTAPRKKARSGKGKRRG